MKIGILTHPLLFNYGGILQNYALQTVLKRMGHEAVTVYRMPDFHYSISASHIVEYGKRLTKYFLGDKSIKTQWNPNLTKKQFLTLGLNIQEFIDTHIDKTREVTSRLLSQIDEEYRFDAYVIGSDQVWIPSYAKESFLDFVDRDNIIRITYAASCGNISWMDNEELKTECLKLSRLFSAFSAREDYLVDKSEKVLGKKVEHVLDPTLLLSKDDYLSVINPQNHEKHFIFKYILDHNEEKEHIVREVAGKLRLSVENGMAKDDFGAYKSIDNWINGINNADFVVTDSFHGTVFCIIFQKPFITIGNELRGLKRMSSLLKQFSLDNRLYQGIASISGIISSDIDFASVNRDICVLKERSLFFLKESLFSV